MGSIVPSLLVHCLTTTADCLTVGGFCRGEGVSGERRRGAREAEHKIFLGQWQSRAALKAGHARYVAWIFVSCGYGIILRLR